MDRHKQSITEDVLQKIKQGDVRMKPHLYFTLLSIISTIAALASGLAIAYLTSILFFWIRVETASTMAYGARRKLSETIAAFPWWAVIVAIALVALAVVLVRKHGSMYRYRASTVAFAIIAVSLVAGCIMYISGIGELGLPQHSNKDSNRRGQGLHQNQ